MIARTPGRRQCYRRMEWMRRVYCRADAAGAALWTMRG
jgi:hypothetical protein